MFEMIQSISEQSDLFSHITPRKHKVKFMCERCERAKATHELHAVDEDGDSYYSMLCDPCAIIENLEANGYVDRGNPHR